MTTWPDLLAYYPAWLDYRRWYLRLPGVQWAVRRAGDLVSDGALGHADLATGEPLTTGHLFRVASHSKSLTSVLVLQLVEQGRLRRDDALADHLPELAGTALAERTIDELLTHSGGVIRDGEDGDFWQFHHDFPDRAALLRVAAADSATVLARNEHYKYSNIGYGLLGMVLETVTGEPFAGLVQQRIAAPLGLTDLGGELDTARRDEYAAGHGALATTRSRAVLPHVDTHALAAATGAYATARDLTAFFSALLPGRDELLQADSLRLQRHRHWDVKPGEHGYAVGLALDHLAGTDLFGHTGGYPGHITASFADAGSGHVVSAFANAIDGPASQLASAYFRLRRLASDADHARTDASAQRFTGRFASTWTVLDVIRLDDRLFAVHPVAADPAEDAVPLEVVDERTLRIVGGRGGNSYGELMRYEFDHDGTVTSLRADSGMTLIPFAVQEAE